MKQITLQGNRPALFSIFEIGFFPRGIKNIELWFFFFSLFKMGEKNQTLKQMHLPLFPNHLNI